MRIYQALYRALAALAALGALLCAWPRPSASQGGPNLVITHVDTSHYPTVDVYIGARDGDAATLDPAQPVALHEHVGGTITRSTPNVTAAVRGVSVLVLVDLHRRMRGIGMPDVNHPGTTLNRLDTAREATVRLAQALRKAAPNNSRFGVLGYHRDLIEIMPFQPLASAPNLVESYMLPGGARQRLFDIERKPVPTRPNDKADPHAQSALSLAVGFAAGALAAQAPPGQQQVIVIIGSTCTDLQPQLTDRNDVTCDSVDTVLQQIKQRNHAGLLTIYGVGVGSDNQYDPQIDRKIADPGFNYTANFNQIEHFVAGLPGRFFRLHTTDPNKAPDTWSNFDQRIAGPIAHQASQLKLSFAAAPRPAGTAPYSASIEIQLAGTTLHTSYAIPQIELLLNSTPIAGPSISLTPGPAALAARYRANGAEINTDVVQVLVSTPVAPAAVSPGKTTLARAEPYLLERISIFVGVIAFLLAILALLYWLWLSRPSAIMAEQPDNILFDQEGTAKLDQDVPRGIPGQKTSTAHYLEQLRGPLPGAIYPIYGPIALLGSAKGEVAILIDDQYTSPKHATLEIKQIPNGTSANNQDEGLYVTDDHSLNGTWIDEQLLEPGVPAPLQPDHLLTIGLVTFRYTNSRSPTAAIKQVEDGRGKTVRFDALASAGGTPATAGSNL